MADIQEIALGGGSVATGVLQLASGVALDTTLRNVTDQAGTASPLQLSTTQVNIGGGTSLGRLVVRGDGTNPIARFESSAGLAVISITEASGILLGNASSKPTISPFSATGAAFDLAGTAIGFNPTNQSGFSYWMSNSTITSTAAESGYISLYGIFAAAAGAANFRPLKILYTINNSGAQTGTATGIFLNATETALNSMTHNLIDLGTGGGTYVSRFKVGRILDVAFNFNDSADRFSLFSISRVGSPATPVLFFGSGSGPTGTQGRIAANGDNLALGTVASGIFTERLIVTTTNLIAFGGTTNAFPALKRNGAALEVRLADDSGFAALQASQFTSNLFVGTTSGRMDLRAQYDMSIGLGFTGGVGGLAISQATGVSPNASALLDVVSTTKGFLPPRMTTTQVNLIATPAEGLVVYNTTISHLCVYQSGVWVRINHSPM